VNFQSIAIDKISRFVALVTNPVWFSGTIQLVGVSEQYLCGVGAASKAVPYACSRSTTIHRCPGDGASPVSTRHFYSAC
jgi:hypothetical protein